MYTYQCFRASSLYVLFLSENVQGMNRERSTKIPPLSTNLLFFPRRFFSSILTEIPTHYEPVRIIGHLYFRYF